MAAPPGTGAEITYKVYITAPNCTCTYVATRNQVGDSGSGALVLTDGKYTLTLNDVTDAELTFTPLPGYVIQGLAATGGVTVTNKGGFIRLPKEVTQDVTVTVTTRELAFNLNIQGDLNVTGAIRMGSAQAGHAISATAPADTGLLWIDTSGSTPKLKFHNGTSWTAL